MLTNSVIEEEKIAMNNTTVWPDFYRATAGQPPHQTLLAALARFEAERPGNEPGFAIDLGCGAGRDTFELLRRGWHVLAVDRQPEALAHLEAQALPAWQSRLQTQVAGFEQLRLPPARLVNASFALPFCQPGDFKRLWAEIVQALPPGGRFAGHFFGPNDSWANTPEMTFQTEAEVRALLAEFEIELFEERDEEGKTALGDSKHWHIFGVVARKLDSPL
jgi:SAM-dependent methyltransferase